jgi:hypothetical protein
MALTSRAIVRLMTMKIVLPNIVIASVRKCRMRAIIALNSAERLATLKAPSCESTCRAASQDVALQP